MTKEPDYGAELRTFGNSSAPSGPETQGIDSWEDAGALPSGLGSSTVPPDATRDIVGPGEESGTFASFVELVIEEFNEDRGAEATTRPDYQASADDNVILQGIQGSETSFGWVGFARSEERRVGNECVSTCRSR